MNKEAAYDELWDDFLLLCENHKEALTPPEFGYGLINFTAKMLLDLAPSHQEALEVANLSIRDALKCKCNELEEQKKGVPSE